MVFGHRCYRRHCSQETQTLMTLEVNGLHTEQTIKALQIALKSYDMPRVGPADGRLGKRTVRALQTFLWSKGVNPGPVDGWWGKKTIKALQQWLASSGFYAGQLNGEDSATTFVALQKALNAIADEQLEKFTPEKMEKKAAVVVEAPTGEV